MRLTGLENEMDIELLGTTRRPVVITKCPALWDARKGAAKKVSDLLLKMGIVAVTCRGVPLDRLPVIISNGCDVLPTDSPIFADFMDKAIEYGGAAQVVQIFDIDQLKRTFTEVSAHIDSNKIQKLKETYKSWEKSGDREKIWFSMLQFEDQRRTTSHEVAYGWFIPGNPWDALIALAIFVETDQQRDYALGLLGSWIDPSGASHAEAIPSCQADETGALLIESSVEPFKGALSAVEPTRIGTRWRRF